MNTAAKLEPSQELIGLCSMARTLIAGCEYNKCLNLICKAMSSFPDAPHPHNLLGILLEKQGDHAAAMRHFRAAYALDPSYSPARLNLEAYGTFFSRGSSVYGDESVSDGTAQHCFSFNGRNG